MKREAAVTLKRILRKKKKETKFWVQFSGKYYSQIKIIC